MFSADGGKPGIELSPDVPDGPVALRTETAEPAAAGDPRGGPDVVSPGFEAPDGAFTAPAALDGRHPSTEVAGGFTGRAVGVYATSGTLHADWFDSGPN